MDYTEKRHVQNPQLSANPISRFLWLWIIPLLIKGRKKDLTIDDLYDRLPEDDASTLGDKMQRIWENECKQAKSAGKRPKFFKAARRFFGVQFFYYTFYVFINEMVFKLSQPFILRSMIRSFANDSEKKQIDNRNEQYIFTGALIFVTLTYAVNLHHIYAGLGHLAMKGRIGTSSLIYRKVLRLSKAIQSEKASVGKLCNLVGSDANRFDACFFHSNMLLVGPIQLVIMTYFLYDELGVACFVGIGLIAGFLIPFQAIVGRLSAKYRASVAYRTDERGRMLGEIIMGIRIIKMYAWEKAFSSVIHKLRKLEIMPIRKASYLKGTFQAVSNFGKMTVPFSTFVIYVSLGNSLTAEKAYFAISIYIILIQSMAQKIPVAMAAVAETLVAIRRIEDYLLLEELQSNVISKQNKVIPMHLSKTSLISTSNGCDTKNDLPVPGIRLSNVSAKWNEDRQTLQNISINLQGAALVFIVGPVGCGKSSLLSLLTSELQISSGSIEISGNLSYSNQEAFIFSGNLRQNILFGSLYDKTRYKNIIRVCGLEQDIEQWIDGDKTIVGEMGVSLSGGQKARVALARALYRKAAIYLIDEALGALDTRVGKYVVEKCLKEHLDGSLRIVVTHQLQYLHHADWVIVLNEIGQIKTQGKFQDLVAQKVEFFSMPESENITTSGDGDGESSLSSNEDDDNTTVTLSSTNKSIPNSKTTESLEEKKNTGKVDFKTYLAYIKAGNSKVELVAAICVFFFCQGITSFTDKWISWWTNEVSRRSLPNASLTEAQYTDETYIMVYSICVGTTLVLVLTKAILYFHYCMTISVNLHESMFGSLVRAPIRWYDKNSSGRILNRFCKDLNQVDESLPSTLNDTVSIFLHVSGIMIVVISTNYYLAVPSVLFIFILVQIRKFYVKTSRDVKRIESITKSPIFLHLSASVQGLTTIRGLEAQEIVVDQFDSFLDINTSPTYLTMIGNRWMGIWMDFSCILFLISVAGSFILFTSTAKGGNIGMAITLTLSLLLMAQWGMRQYTDLENYMTSVERVFEYCHIKPEAPLLDSKADGKTKNWPNKGAIKFCDVSLSYDENNQVLKNISFEIKGGEKVGIVGRTGAGKSSIIVALFRLTEPQGKIYIDGVNIKDIGLHTLRKAIGIVPQDPILFSGSLRYNLDPFNEYPDEKLWEALQEVELKNAVPSLDFKVADSGSNFSVGERQLVCLARAILRNNSIILMDEATANVDMRTDNLIQKTIRSNFKDCTILTIAHRLNTVLDCDKILVLDNGFIQEFDTPTNLLQNPNGLFSLMINQAGSAMAETILRKVATVNNFI